MKNLLSIHSIRTPRILITAALPFCHCIARAATSAAGLPWEAPLQVLATSLTGPVALGISIIAMAAAGGTLIFGGELGEFTRKALLLVLAISFLVFGSGFMSALFGISGALV